MNDIIKCILERRAIRRYKPEQITEDELNTILTAGLYAPSAGGRQSVLFVVSQEAEVNGQLGRINKSLFPGKVAAGNVSREQPSIADDAFIFSGFYGAPTVISLFDVKGSMYAAHNCAVAAENMMLAAHSLGIGSCMVGRADETFASDLGIELLAKWNVNDHYEAICHLVLGYPINTPTTAKPRKDGRIIRV